MRVVVSRRTFEASARRLRALAYAGVDSVELRVGALRELAGVVAMDGAFFPTADPATLLYTSAVRVDLPDGVTAEFLHNEFHQSDVNKFRVMAATSRTVATLDASTQGDRTTSPRSRKIMEPIGLGDELRVVFRTTTSTWGFACLHRSDGMPSFDASEIAFVEAVAPHLAEALRRSVMAERAAHDASEDGPGVLTLAPDMTVLGATPAGERWLDDLAATERPPSRPLPMAVLAVAQALDDLEAADRVPRLTVRAASGRWLVLHASHLATGTGSQLVVVIEPASPAELEPVIAAGYQLTPREAETLTLLLRGLPTKAIAATLRVSTHTAYDHVKAIFAKTGVGSRGQLMATVFHDYQRLHR